LANLAVFIPVLFVKDEAGQLFRDIALATASALVLSLLVALVVVPTASARILGTTRFTFLKGKFKSWQTNGHASSPGGRALAAVKSGVGILDRFGAAFVNLVVRINTWLQAHSSRLAVTSIGFLVVTFALTILLLYATQIEYLPTGNRNLVIARMLPPPGYNIDQMRDMGAQLESRLEPYWDVDPDSPEAAELDYPPIEDFFYVARGRMLFMGMRAEDPTRASELVPLVKQVSGDLPDMMTMAFQSSLFERGLSAGRNIEMEITGPDIQRITELGREVFGQLPGVFPEQDPLTGKPEFQAMPVPSLEIKSPELHVTAKRDQAEDQGIRNVELGYAVNALVDGAYATDYYLQGDKIDLSIVGDEEFASRTQHLATLPIATPLGGLSELAAIAKIEYRTGPEQINHRERERAVSIMVTPPPHVAMEEAIERIESRIMAPMAAEGKINDGQYAINLSGAADKLRQAWDAMKWNLLLALVITYLVMAALFESWLYPFVIILSVPLGAVGGFFGLWLLNVVGGPFGISQSLDVLTMLGFIILIGTVVNNPILIVEQALNHIRNDDMPHRQAVVESVRTRIRPIFMTTLIGFFGLLPLVLSPGAGAELYRGLGSVLLGGLMVSTVFTLFLVPSLFSLALEMRDAVASRVSFLRPTERHEHPVPALTNGDRLPQRESLPVE
jgi:HAE1 family hydrophobic/amphiphilic exporter-1